MNRRNFLIKTPAVGLAVGISGTLTGACNSPIDNFAKENKTQLQKVVLAMLSMQRATWEQGVAMQALLELGEKELVILMAKDAVLRQSADGRLAMLGEEFALTDAASPGEAVLWAARETGDTSLVNGFERLHEYVIKKAPRNDKGIIFHFTNIPRSGATVIICCHHSWQQPANTVSQLNK
jgi:unsaturated rhamnogalacturonyl hydrolase